MGNSLCACTDVLHAGHQPSTMCMQNWDDPLDPGRERTTIGELCTVCTRSAVCHRVRRHLVARGVINVDRIRVTDRRLRLHNVDHTHIDQLLALAKLYRDAKQRVLSDSVSTKIGDDKKRDAAGLGKKKSLLFDRFMTTWSREYMDPGSDFAAL